MAKREVVEVIDDIDGKLLEEYETIQFSVDGRSYEFDTSAAHAEKFRADLQKYLSVSRPVRNRRRGTPVARNAGQTQVIREWALSNGYTVSDRGRIPAHIAEAFDAVH